jgi:hypothetical protein
MAYLKAILQTQYPLASLSSPVTTSLQNPHSTQPFLFAQQSLSKEALQRTKSDTPFQVSNFNLPPATQIGIGTVLTLSTLGGFFFLRGGRKKSVPESAILNHDKEFDKIIVLAKQVQQADHEKFTGREFITYLRIKIGLISNQENGLYKSIQFLKLAISSKRYYDQIFVVETQFLGRKQQEFYRFANDFINQNVFGEEFLQKIEAKLTAIAIPNHS